MAHFTMAQLQYGAFQYGAFHYDAGPVLRISVWRIPVCRSSKPDQCVVVSPSCQKGVCILLDTNLYINALQTEYSDSDNVR